jgi:hypothetical protein
LTRAADAVILIAVKVGATGAVAINTSGAVAVTAFFLIVVVVCVRVAVVFTGFHLCPQRRGA